MNGFLQRLVGRSTPGAGEAIAPQLTLAAFGKHPGWDDHIPGIGLETENLARVKQSLYVAGIGSQIDSGAWEKLEAGKRVEGFNHTFLWLRSRQILLGQFWSSTDRKGRAKYPMVLCVESQGVTPRFLLTRVRSELAGLRDACRSATTAELVSAACAATQERMRGLLGSHSGAELQAVAPAEVRRGFLEHPSLGPDRLGLLRIQHELASAFDTVYSEGKSGRDHADANARHLRVPLAGDSTAAQLALWAEFFQCALPPNVSVLLISREGADWIDVINGEPAKDDYFCLQASPAAIPFATQIPYELPPESLARLKDLENKFLDLANVPPALTLPATAATPASRGRKSWLGFVVVGILLASFAGWLLLRGADKKPPVVAPVKLPVAPEAAVPAATNSTDEADAKRRAEEQSKAEAEARLRADEKSKTEVGALRLAREKLAAEAKARQEAEARRLAEEKAKAEADRLAEVKRAAEAEAQRLAEEQRVAGEKAAAEVSRIAAQQAQREREFAAAIAAGRTALTVTNYVEALARAEQALTLKPGDPAALALQAAAGLPKELAEAEALFAKRDYAAALALCAKHPSVAAFDALAAKARAAKNQTVTEQQQTLLQQLDARLELLRVQFGLLKATDAVTEDAQKAAKLVGLSNAAVDFYQNQFDQLEQAYPPASLNQNDRGSNLKKLKDKIRYARPL